MMCVLLTIGFGLIGWDSIYAAFFSQSKANESQQILQDTADTDTRIRQAVSYNERIASGSQIIGENTDPFGNPNGDFSFSDDTEYQDTLNAGGGIMGIIKIPKISLELPIYHGSSAQVLNNGIGHLHGTSLPVGGMDTHTVLTGHRGLQGKELFTRLDEMQVGDPIYLDVMGETLAYKVDRIDPMDTPEQAVDKLHVTRGEDRLTLVTCTPLFVNTHRLLVSATRASMPDVAPYPQDAPKDRPWIIRYWKGLLALIPTTGFVTACVWPSRKKDTAAHRPTGPDPTTAGGPPEDDGDDRTGLPPRHRSINSARIRTS